MLILLDRDGVINVDHEHGVRSIEEFMFIPGSIRAIQAFNQAGIPLAIVTNQALVGRGEILLTQLEAIHQHMKDVLKAQGAFINHIFFCTDTTIEPHFRRKPAPGMLLEAMNYFHTLAEDTIMVGDALRDLQAAHAAGCRRILVRTGKGMRTLQENLNELQPVEVYDDLWQVSKSLLAEFKRSALHTHAKTL
jgi:D-glycero-D-manno-heptose 1,7-bisphosphate phosphatase